MRTALVFASGMVFVLLSLGLASDWGAPQTPSLQQQGQQLVRDHLAAGGHLSASDAANLEDGVIDFDEYRAAVFAYRQCMQEIGRPLSHFRLDATLDLYEYEARESGRARNLARDCYDNHLHLMDRLWQMRIEPTVTRLQNERRAGITASLEKVGMPVDGSMPYPELVQEFSATVPECFMEGQTN